MFMPCHYVLYVYLAIATCVITKPQFYKHILDIKLGIWAYNVITYNETLYYNIKYYRSQIKQTAQACSYLSDVHLYLSLFLQSHHRNYFLFKYSLKILFGVKKAGESEPSIRIK